MDGLSDAKINAAHSVDVRLRINGQDEWWCGESYIKGLIREVAALRKRVQELEQELARGHNLFACDEALSEAQARAERAGRERDEFARKAVEMELLWSGTNAELEDAKADLDAALKWIEGYTDGPSGRGPTSQRVSALLEKRREIRG